MPKKPHTHTDDGAAKTQRASFVLRCWTDKQGQVRTQVVDVRTGVSHPVADLEHLAGVLEKLVTAGGVPDQGRSQPLSDSCKAADKP